MTLSQILSYAATMIDDGSLATKITNNTVSDAQDIAKVNMLINCANQVASIIATDYKHIYKTKVCTSSDGNISFASIDTNGVVGVVWVKSGGRPVDYEVINGVLSTVSGAVSIKYIAAPAVYTAITDTVNDFPTLPARVIAYGVAAEYLFIKGNVEDAESWNKRFEKALFGALRSSKNLVIKPRRWY